MKENYIPGKYVLNLYEKTEKFIILTAAQAKVLFQIYDKIGFQSLELVEEK